MIDRLPSGTAKEILERLHGKPLPPEKQKLLDRLVDQVKIERKIKEARAKLTAARDEFSRINADVIAYADAHGLPLPKE
jgi:hypothetical protein